ncbi:MAG: flavin reductase family protein [Erysipelotrichales bacterium]|nr:flavin reductase family protein [Erysipelotrichales bacterium]
MARQYWKPSNMLYPVPAVLVTCADEDGDPNVMTAAWAGTVCSDPVMVSVSIRKSRYSHDIIQRTGEFVLCLTTEELVRFTDYAGIKSGRKVNKFALPGNLKIHTEEAKTVKAPLIAESPVCLECKVRQILELGSHDMFIAEVVQTDIDDRYLNEQGTLDLTDAHLIAYSHGQYRKLGKVLGTFAYSTKKKKKNTKKPSRR